MHVSQSDIRGAPVQTGIMAKRLHGTASPENASPSDRQKTHTICGNKVTGANGGKACPHLPTEPRNTVAQAPQPPLQALKLL